MLTKRDIELISQVVDQRIQPLEDFMVKFEARVSGFDKKQTSFEQRQINFEKRLTRVERRQIRQAKDMRNKLNMIAGFFDREIAGLRKEIAAIKHN